LTERRRAATLRRKSIKIRQGRADYAQGAPMVLLCVTAARVLGFKAPVVVSAQ